MEKLISVLHESLDNQGFVLAILSGVRKPSEQTFKKVIIKPVKIQGDLCYQITYEFEKQVQHKNLPAKNIVEEFKNLMSGYFKRANLFTLERDYQALVSKKGKVTVISKPPSKEKVDISHNRRKNYLLQENVPYPFLIKLGVMNSEGKVLTKRYDKFKQLNRFLEIVADCISHLQTDKVIRIIDFGCGKAYLTFALYHYLVEQLQLQVEIIGLDLKEDVVNYCNDVARELGFGSLQFRVGDIHGYQEFDQVDMVVALHACDTATDDALVKAVKWQADVILAVPCCQHEFYGQLDNPVLVPMLEHGIVKEKLATLVTDSMRAKVLEIMGYSVQILEFIDLEHTPKNLLIRAYKQGKPAGAKSAHEYLAFKEFWQVDPYLEKVMGEEFRRLLIF